MATPNEPSTLHLLRDLRIHAVHRELRPVYRVSEERAQIRGARGLNWDLLLREGRDNLAQAIIMRILTPRGELAALGHPEYGSRVHELVGGRNTSTQRNLLKLYILEALGFEPRVAKVKELVVIPSPGLRTTLDVSLKVLPVGTTGVVQVGPFTIDLGS
jgi:phage baseplate assembly protein W